MTTELQSAARDYLTARLRKMERVSLMAVRENMLLQLESQAELLAALGVFNHREADMLSVHAREVCHRRQTADDQWFSPL